jgi:putative lipoic acid-binding regulatory protein
MQKLCAEFFARTMYVLEQEGIVVESKDEIANLIMRYAPDWRRVLNELQRSSIGGKLNIAMLQSASDQYDDLFEHLKKKDFKKMRKWVSDNMDVDSSVVFRSIYDSMYEKVEPSSIPQLVLYLADYQYKNAFVADHELNMVACMTEIMANVEFQ